MNNEKKFQCPTCFKFYKSYKSLHRHKTLKHPDTIKHKNDRINEYYKNPKKCKHCNILLPYEKKMANRFCSQRCAALFNNNRTVQQKQQINSVRLQTWRKKLGTLNRDVPRKRTHKAGYKRKSPTTKHCHTCSTPFKAKVSQHKYCSSKCHASKHKKVIYRTACSFNLNKKDHPELFKSELIEKHGWYNPKNKPGKTNLNGVCWDHLYSISDGFSNNVPPEIMSHPANAELLPWPENRKRWKTSTITYQELLERIEQWDNGNRDLKYFYSSQ